MWASKLSRNEDNHRGTFIHNSADDPSGTINFADGWIARFRYIQILGLLIHDDAMWSVEQCARRGSTITRVSTLSHLAGNRRDDPRSRVDKADGMID